MTAGSARVDWVAVDWGTSNLRAWAIAADGEVVDSAASADGANGLESGEFEAALLALIGDWIGRSGEARVLICGMAGARRGWQEAPYRDISESLEDLTEDAVSPEARDARLSIHILPGIRQLEPPDVIRGEETQLLGLLDARESFDGLICLPGTHSKWIWMRGRQPYASRTLMTGELFGLMRDRSILRHSLAEEDWDAEAFKAAVGDAWSDPRSVMPAIFQLRASDLLGCGSTAAQRLARLSGLLIGSELASLLSSGSPTQVLIVGTSSLASHYKAALSAVGIEADSLDGSDLVLRGLRFAHDKIWGAKR